jgi:outer membrane protein TolC
MRTAALVLGLWSALSVALPMTGATLTFEEVLARAQRARTVQPMPEDALRTLESPQRFEWPTVRAEGALSNARNIDVFNETAIHNQVFSAIVSVDYPLLDGGAGAVRRRAGALDAASFRQRVGELEEELFLETVDAVAQLYTAQERRKILQRGSERAVTMGQRAGELLRVHEISNVTAAQWQDEAMAAESELIELDLQRLDAETHLKQLIGDTGEEAIEIALPLDDQAAFAAPPPAENDFAFARATSLLKKRTLSFEEARAARRPQVMLSAFGGIAAVPSSTSSFYSSDDERFALYGMRLTIAMPMFDGAARRREAQTRIEAAEAELERTATLDGLRRQNAQTSFSIARLMKRVELLSRGVEVAKWRAESLSRLTAAGMRSEATYARDLADVGRRESELLAARVELWRQAQRMRHRGGDGASPVAFAESR